MHEVTECLLSEVELKIVNPKAEGSEPVVSQVTFGHSFPTFLGSAYVGVVFCAGHWTQIGHPHQEKGLLLPDVARTLDNKS